MSGGDTVWAAVVGALRRQGPLPLQGIAAVTGRSRSSVRAALRRARRHGQAICLDGRLWSATAWWIEHHGALIWSALERWRRTVRADDVQDAIVVLYDLARRHRPTRGRRWSAYVWRWLAPTVYDPRRRHPLDTRSLDRTSVASSYPDPLEAVSTRDQWDWLWECVQALPPEDAALLWQRFRGGRTYAQLSRAVGRPRGWVYRRIRRLLHQLHLIETPPPADPMVGVCRTTR